MNRRNRSGKQLFHLALLTVLWMAFSLRVARIDRQSIWYDEGLSIHYAQGTVAQVLAGASQSDHPPLHALMLHAWMGICGDSELSVRMLSLWWGILTVAWTYRIGRRLSPLVALGALLLTAVSPFAVYFGQETRGYTMALALVLAAADAAFALYPGLGAAHHPSPRNVVVHGMAYTVAGAAALYTHFYSAFVLAALNLAFVVALVRAAYAGTWRQARALVVPWLVAQVAVLALFAPWLPLVAAQLERNATYWHGAVGWRQILTQTLMAFSVGTTLEGLWAQAATCVLVLLAMLGTYALWQRQDGDLWLVPLWAWCIVPILILIWINQSRAKFAPRYAMNGLPPFILLSAAGAAWLLNTTRKRAFTLAGWVAMAVALVCTAVVGGATARSLGNLYFDQSRYRPDVRAVAGYIASHALPDDLIVLVAGYNRPAFSYYYRGPLPVLPLPEELLPTTRRPLDLSALDVLNQAIVGRQRLWLVLWQEDIADPTGLIADELQHTYPRLGVGRTFHGMALMLFDVSQGPRLSAGAPQFALRADLGEQIRLWGYDLPSQTFRPGDTVYLYLYWESLIAMQHDYKVFAHVIDAQDEIVAQRDQIAGAAAYPTSHWPVGALVRDRILITLPGDASPGRYTLIVGLYRPGQELTRLSVVGDRSRGDHVHIGEIEIQDRATQSPIGTRLDPC